MDAPAPSSPDSVDSLRPRRWLSPRMVLVLLMILTAGTTAAILGGRPLYRAWCEQRARTLAKEATAHLDAGRLEQASVTLNQAYKKNPSEPAVLRAIARMLMGTGTDAEKAAHFWRQLLKTGDATTSDRAAMARNLLFTGDGDEARRMLASFSAQERATRSVMELESDILRGDGQLARADAVLREALLLEPENPECILKLAAMDLSNPFQEFQVNAMEKLWVLARGEGAFALQSISMLAGNARLTAPQSQELLELVQKHEAASPALRYQVLASFVRLHPQERRSVLEREIEARRSAPAETSLDLLRWLITEGEHDRVLSLVPQKRAVMVPALFPIYIEALAGQKRWKELREMLRTSSSLPLSPAYLSLLQARCSHGLGEAPELIRGQLQEACRRALAARDLSGLQRASSVAETVGYPEVAVKALQDALSVPQFHVPVLEGLFAIHSRQRDSEAMLSTLLQLQAARPGVRMHMENLLYLKLLLGLEMESIDAQLATLTADSRISQQSGRFLQALAAFRMADIKVVREKLAGVDSSGLPGGQRAVFAGLLHASGEPDRAFAVGEKIARPLLLPEEERLLLQAL